MIASVSRLRRGKMVVIPNEFEMQGIHELRVTIPDNLDTVEK